MARREANSAIMALLVGSQMTAHFLSLTVGSQHLLPAMFPAVSHVRRFNLTSDKAREVLLNADAHLGTMAVPYALAIHEDFLRTCLELLGITSEPAAARLHSTLASRAGGGFDSDSLAQFHVLREMRNAVIHLGGRVNQRLVGCANRLSPSAETAWKKVVGRSPRRLGPDDVVELGTGELFLSLAATKNLARQANKMLVPALRSRTDPLMRNMPACNAYRPDFGALTALGSRLVLAAGVESGQQLAARGARSVTGQLGLPVTEYPSHHGGFLGGEYGQHGDPEAFATALRATLD
ncbi:MAG: hypothetical protein GEU83_17860 [Pseudonocardiaceae bacterium]|nr:hypothetical protein [Pseudonocardiaceae bacterium]